MIACTLTAQVHMTRENFYQNMITFLRRTYHIWHLPVIYLRMAEFEALGCSLIACSTDSHFSHLAWWGILFEVFIENLNWRLIKVPEAQEGGRAWRHDDASPCGQEHGHQPRLWGSQGGWGSEVKSLSWSFFGKKIHRQHHFSFRGLFVIDKSGTLRQITINDLPVGRDVDETLRLVQVIQI